MCNESKPHTAIVGSYITYSCSFKYYGGRIDPFIWEGPGTIRARTSATVNRSNQYPIWKETYTGEHSLNIVISSKLTVH